MIKDRIAEVVAATSGTQKEFAAKIGIEEHTLSKILKNGTNSLSTVAAILNACPEVDARWLITGEGAMIRPFGLSYAEKLFTDRLSEILALAALVPKMDGSQVRRFSIALSKGEVPKFSKEEIAKLQ